MLNVTALRVVMLSVITLNAVMLSVVAPKYAPENAPLFNAFNQLFKL
jgi:hypothetical protein